MSRGGKGRGSRRGSRDGDDRGEADGDDASDRATGFADLVGEAKPLRGGPARVDPKRPPRRRPGAEATASSRRRFRFPDPDEPRLAAAPGTSDAQLRALRRGEPAPGERIDLHGVRSDAAPRLLLERLESARARGVASVIVIHGHGQRSATGEAVLRDGLPGWLSTGACARHVRGFAPAPPRLGGEGATLVLLRRPDRPA
jgi:DNA-nicking Smr family endonuclease